MVNNISKIGEKQSAESDQKSKVSKKMDRQLKQTETDVFSCHIQLYFTVSNNGSVIIAVYLKRYLY